MQVKVYKGFGHGLCLVWQWLINDFHYDLGAMVVKGYFYGKLTSTAVASPERPAGVRVPTERPG
jgi:hypothetical protein